MIESVTTLLCLCLKELQYIHLIQFIKIIITDFLPASTIYSNTHEKPGFSPQHKHSYHVAGCRSKVSKHALIYSMPND